MLSAILSVIWRGLVSQVEKFEKVIINGQTDILESSDFHFIYVYRNIVVFNWNDLEVRFTKSF